MGQPGTDMVDVLEAAALAGRSAETVRRWVWSGRLRARRHGRRLMIARSELDALIRLGSNGSAANLADWLLEAEDLHDATVALGSSAADLVVEDRARRSSAARRRARR